MLVLNYFGERTITVIAVKCLTEISCSISPGVLTFNMEAAATTPCYGCIW